jgi:hypothetical protein
MCGYGMEEKHKATIVSKLFIGTEMPFTKQVTIQQLPNKFKVPQILSYSRIGDLTKHLENYRMHLAFHATLDEVASRAFRMTLSRNAREWF